MAQPVLVKLALNAMGTRFELALYGQDERFLHTVGEEALAEIERLDAQLSFYRETSDISMLNAEAASRPVPVDPRVFRLLARAKALSEATDGAFDITVAPLMRCWGFVGGTGALPSEPEIEAARALVGMQHVHLDPEAMTVAYDAPGVLIDLGAVGKGYAIDRAAEILRDMEVTCALLHGGTSSVYAIGAPPEADAWRIALQRPFGAEGDEPLATVGLRDQALSVSAPHHKWFEAAGRRFGHVIDPRTGYPASRHLLAALVTDEAADGDALSTALLARGPEWISTLASFDPKIQALVAVESETGVLDLTVHGGGWKEFA